MEYGVLKSELTRRRLAFRIFVGFLFLGAILAGYNFFMANQVALVVSAFAVSIFTWSDWSLGKFFARFKETTFTLSEKAITRITPTAREEFKLSDIEKIIVKMTTRNNVRELKLFLKDGKVNFFNGLAEFDEFTKELIKKVGDRAKVEEIREHLDFDNNLFYVVLGLLVGFISVKGLDVLLNLTINQLQIAYYVFTAYVFVLGLYFLFYQPLSKWYGKKEKRSDLVLGALILFGSIACLSIALTF